MSLSLAHLVSVDDLTSEEVAHLLELAAHLKQKHEAGPGAEEWKPYRKMLDGYVMATVFYEASTRTRLSFESAMFQLGGTVISTENAAEFSSAIKGETLHDSIRVISNYAHVIVLRHKELGQAAEAASASTVPVLNAGDAHNEHPSQALLDLFTIWEVFRNQADLTLTVVGDLIHGRTIHSLLKLLARQAGIVRCIYCVAPQALQLPSDLALMLRTAGIEVHFENQLTPALATKSDIVYMTRTQAERGSVMHDQSAFTLTEAVADALPTHAMIMHPLPRNSELPKTIDSRPQARYFTQAKNGLYVRMALLLELLLRKG